MKVIKKVKKTTAVHFKDIKVGDVLEFSMKLSSKGRGRAGLYATTITVSNLTQGTSDSSKSQTEVSKYLAFFEMEEVE